MGVSPAAVLGFVVCGVALGTASGLVPGLHANNFALLLAATAPAVPGPPVAVTAAMLAAGVVHTFLDAVPALALGVPDASMAATALPGHRLVVAGQGREAVRLSALGSGLAVVLAVPLAVPVTRLMVVAWPTLRAHLPLVLGLVVLALVATERSWGARVAGLGAFLAASALGAATLDLSPAAPLSAGGVLTPLFAGLFGAPVLVEAVGGRGVPPQADPRVRLSGGEVARTGLAGTLGGAAVGYLPGVSAAVAAVVVLTAVPGDDPPTEGTGPGERRRPTSERRRPTSERRRPRGERRRVSRAGGAAGPSAAGGRPGVDGGRGPAEGLDAARRYVVATSGVNTANTVFALFALLALGTPRTGVLVAVERTGRVVLWPALVAVGVAAACGFVLVLSVGDGYLRLVGRLDATRLSLALLSLLGALSWLFAGLPGVGIYAVATLVGLVPPRLGCRRVHLMGVLIGPLMLGV
jgi:putative membrane protein